MADVVRGLSVDKERVSQVGRRLHPLHVWPDPYLNRSQGEAERRAEANYWFYITAICQSTRTFEGVVDGQWARGWDYLVRASRRQTGHFTAERMRAYTAEDLLSLLSEDQDPAHSPIDRVEERLEQLHDCARRLLADYGGEALAVYQCAAGRLAGEGGLLDLLSEFSAYSDPLRKKALLLAAMLHESGVWPLDDAGQLKVPMDYHVMRVALRSGMVVVEDEALATALRQHCPVSETQDAAVRTAVSTACDALLAEVGWSVYAFDKLLWHLGRSCCFYEHEPICGAGASGVACTKAGTCSLLRATDYACAGRCVLDGVCRGSREAAYRAYWETNLYTPHY